MKYDTEYEKGYLKAIDNGVFFILQKNDELPENDPVSVGLVASIGFILRLRDDCRIKKKRYDILDKYFSRYDEGERAVKEKFASNDYIRGYNKALNRILLRIARGIKHITDEEIEFGVLPGYEFSLKVIAELRGDTAVASVMSLYDYCLGLIPNYACPNNEDLEFFVDLIV